MFNCLLKSINNDSEHSIGTINNVHDSSKYEDPGNIIVSDITPVSHNSTNTGNLSTVTRSVRKNSMVKDENRQHIIDKVIEGLAYTAIDQMYK